MIGEFTAYAGDASGPAASLLPPPGAGVTAALPRSPLHLRLLRDAGVRPDILLYRDDHLAPHMTAAEFARALYLGRELRWPGRPLRTARRANARYYPQVRRVLDRWRIDRLILFLESEPLENCIRDHLGDPRIELWEEGLSHYVDFHGPVYDGLRAGVQAAAGFYPRRIRRRRADRSGFAAVRDRFEHGGIPAVPPAAPADPPAVHDAILVAGAPLVQDRLVSRRRYLRAVEEIALRARQPVVYYAHPREDTAPLAELERIFGRKWFRVMPNTGDVADHAAANRYHAYLAALSTALLDLAAFGPAAMCPALFGLHRAHRRLSRLRFLPARVIANGEDLERFCEDAQAQAHGADAAAPHCIEPQPEIAV